MALICNIFIVTSGPSATSVLFQFIPKLKELHETQRSKNYLYSWTDKSPGVVAKKLPNNYIWKHTYWFDHTSFQP